MATPEEQLVEAKQQIAQLEEALRIAQEELQFFVYAASHDLQQPLRAIGTYAQLLQREFPADQRAREFTGVIVEGVAQMNVLIADLLTYARTGNVANPTQLQLNGPLQWALFNLSNSIRDAGAKITAGELPEVLADEKQMVAIFENLLSNSLKFRGVDTPTVEVTGETGEHFHTISVHDNGCGIKSEYLEKVFEPFRRLHGREIPGSGLGLSTCRKIMRAHHGTIWVESDGSSGTTTKFTVPV